VGTSVVFTTPHFPLTSTSTDFYGNLSYMKEDSRPQESNLLFPDRSFARHRTRTTIRIAHYGRVVQ
jgi:hypothetical protein